MSDPNTELVGLVATRGEHLEPSTPSSSYSSTAGIGPAEWNVPIDQIQADCMTVWQIIRGQIAELKARAACWRPTPCP